MLFNNMEKESDEVIEGTILYLTNKIEGLNRGIIGIENKILDLQRAIGHKEHDIKGYKKLIRKYRKELNKRGR